MNPQAKSRLITTALMVAGVGVAAWIGSKLQDRDDLDVPLNPFGVNRSPYGEVFAMALQGPINTNFHVGMYGATPAEMAQLRKERAGQQNPQNDEPGSLLIVKPDPNEIKEAPAPPPSGPLERMERLIADMQVGHIRRTNPLPASDMLKFHIRRQTEDKLRMAYNLDPSHYANYAALHFFLIEGITTRPEMKEGVGQLARDTIDYCLSIDYDPRPALTAAAACTNILHVMFTAERTNADFQYTPEEMDEVVAELDECIATYYRIAADWDKNGYWERLSPARVESCIFRIDFITKMRNTAVKTVQRIRETYAN